MKDLEVFPKDHGWYGKIVYDRVLREYYNRTTDIFLCDDDIKFYKLKPLSEIPIVLPKPLPDNYFQCSLPSS